MTNEEKFTLYQSILERPGFSGTFFSAPNCNALVFSEGLCQIVTRLDGLWLVEMVASHLDKLTQAYQEDASNDMFLVKLKVNNKNKGELKISNFALGDKGDEACLVSQGIDDTSFPFNPESEETLQETEYTFYLSLGEKDPLLFALLLPTEY
ncbi:MAG: hypothetical protein Q4D21_03225 [Phascolarctobacterium sp.]|nr:hypothetical protein [Phascolarctobacterium sp.]